MYKFVGGKLGLSRLVDVEIGSVKRKLFKQTLINLYSRSIGVIRLFASKLFCLETDLRKRKLAKTRGSGGKEEEGKMRSSMMMKGLKGGDADEG